MSVSSNKETDSFKKEDDRVNKDNLKNGVMKEIPTIGVKKIKAGYDVKKKITENETNIVELSNEVDVFPKVSKINQPTVSKNKEKKISAITDHRMPKVNFYLLTIFQ